MRDLYKENKKYVDKLLFLVGFFVFAYIFLTHLLVYVAPFIIGLIISAIISPLVGFIQRKLKIARSITTIFLIIVLILLLAIAATSLINRIITETRHLYDTIPNVMEEATSFLYNLENRFERYMTFLPDSMALDFNEIIGQLVSMLSSWLGDFVMNMSVGFVTNVPLILMYFFLSLISAFFFTKDRKMIGEAISKAVPEWLKTRARTIRSGVISAIGGYIRAQLIIMSVVFSISLLGLVILRHPYPVMMALLIALLDTVPMIGTGLVLWPWAIFSFVSGEPMFAIGLIAINVTCFVTRQFLEPKVLGQQIGLHPLLVLLGIYMGLRIFGVVGIFLGPVFMVIAKLIVSQKTEDRGQRTEAG